MKMKLGLLGLMMVSAAAYAEPQATIPAMDCKPGDGPGGIVCMVRKDGAQALSGALPPIGASKGTTVIHVTTDPKGASDLRLQRTPVGATPQGVLMINAGAKGSPENLDTDKDGRITLDEFQKTSEDMFKRLDKNGDGALTDNELTWRIVNVPAFPPPQSPAPK